MCAMCICAHAGVCPAEVRRGHLISWSWSYMWFVSHTRGSQTQLWFPWKSSQALLTAELSLQLPQPHPRSQI